MKKLVQTFRNIWTIEELRNKIIVTLALVLTYRFGTHIVLPGIDPNKIEAAANSAKSNGLLGIFDMFAGGAFSQASILALGIMPYISASIFMQLMTILVPQLQKVQKEGESGRKKINQWTRYLTVIVTLFQAGAYVAYLNSPGYAEAILPAYKPFFWFSTVVTLTAGTLFVMWLGERIQDKGLGNGTSIIIMVGILARLPQSIIQEFGAKGVSGGGGLLIFLIEIAVLVSIIMGLIILVQGVRKIPVNYAKQIIGSRQFGGARQFLPVKVNSAGVMPIIFAQAIMFLPTLVSFTNLDSASGIVKIFNDHSNAWYMLIYSVMVIGFTFLYTALIFNPKQIAEDLKRNNGFVPGVKPGQPTADYIGAIMDKITLPGAIFLALVGILPGFAQRLGVTQGFSTFFGGTSLLIMVGVVLDTLQQIETYLLMRQYDGLMNSGRVQGRQGVTSTTI
ncbi:preprotein translocase subunit SecY [Sediminibacterium sp.]|uniref:preprotein translocase subunit SecY n=1 Tax=Sediminibacterium sp. TaxID=1917865 RepID=UPI0008ADD074|nr:preprotein translocase subunit SecY [Sediminibacterium sp.]MBA4257521.1 preprotein translocase subunit SecY [Chitinophaga sp.]OHC84869.1 MAG: preprotein translocase subunit SecY [Sphingobacteriia bacterium RIFOXYC2_FULL_35_18]OHC88943.1 MAG: preprotein translocase subunit SecY [Sphingobacteriia bacterium RIFOXYD2_FULL_35_12]OYY11278.1 MAG: preprotein translocase subunit SecY [Sphingobacteriia bacterium 35-36-14]OYZ01175.1 MAG: preprotein translocase subunit SecY [Sphingobacteriia bacterium 